MPFFAAVPLKHFSSDRIEIYRIRRPSPVTQPWRIIREEVGRDGDFHILAHTPLRQLLRGGSKEGPPLA